MASRALVSTMRDSSPGVNPVISWPEDRSPQAPANAKPTPTEPTTIAAVTATTRLQRRGFAAGSSLRPASIWRSTMAALTV